MARKQKPVDPSALTVEDAASALQVGRTTMYALLKSGKMKSFTIGRARRIPKEAIHSFIEQQTQDDFSASPQKD